MELGFLQVAYELFPTTIEIQRAQKGQRESLGTQKDIKESRRRSDVLQASLQKARRQQEIAEMRVRELILARLSIFCWFFALLEPPGCKNAPLGAQLFVICEFKA